MSLLAAASPSPAAADVPADVPAAVLAERLAKERVEKQLRRQDRLADIAMNLAEAVNCEATAAPEDGLPRDMDRLAATLERAARVVRSADMAQARLIAELRKFGEKGGGEEPIQVEIMSFGDPNADPAVQAARRASDIRNSIRRVALAEGRSGLEIERLARLAGERLERLEPRYADRPLSELFAGFCSDLGLAPDWPDLADEGWVREEIASGVIGAPLKAVKAAEQDLPPLGNGAETTAARRFRDAPGGRGRGPSGIAPESPSSASPTLHPLGEGPPGRDSGSPRGDSGPAPP